MPHPSGRPWIVAHRGSANDAAPNTVEAFRAARRLGADAVEFDVRRTADDVVVVIHDATVGPDDTPLIDLSRSDLSRIAPHVPDLDEAIAACEGMWVDVEVKNNPSQPDWDPDDLTLRIALGALEHLEADDRLLVSSFNLPTVDRARAAGLSTGWLLPGGIEPATAHTTWHDHPHKFVLPSVGAMGPEMAEQTVAAFSELGVEVGVWNANDPDEVRRLTAAGVGTIFTDDVAMAVEVVARTE
jgi:glycerophosphoryl diester phosphodiesterase